MRNIVAMYVIHPLAPVIWNVRHQKVNTAAVRTQQGPPIVPNSPIHASESDFTPQIEKKKKSLLNVVPHAHMLAFGPGQSVPWPLSYYHYNRQSMVNAWTKSPPLSTWTEVLNCEYFCETFQHFYCFIAAQVSTGIKDGVRAILKQLVDSEQKKISWQQPGKLS